MERRKKDPIKKNGSKQIKHELTVGSARAFGSNMYQNKRDREYDQRLSHDKKGRTKNAYINH